jgi:cytochrome b561
MSKSNCPTTFDAISRFNHWIVAIAMIGMLGFGLYLENVDLARSVKGPLIGLHKSIGVAILIYGLWRVGYRLQQGFPAALGNAPTWQEIAAKTVHWLLLASIVIMPLSGLMMSVFGGRPVNVFGVLMIPAIGDFPAIGKTAGAVHAIAGKLLIAVIGIHVLGVLKHRIFDRDATLSRMVTGRVE